tara:strand:- start:58209 stop:60134 length:1926 start_codon:yes stop_codon:yes gene_type:complete
MIEDFYHSIAQILCSNGASVGAGLVIDSAHVVTCAHVVADALGISRDNFCNRNGGEVTVTRPYGTEEDRNPRSLTIEKIITFNNNDNVKDLALLKLKNNEYSSEKALPKFITSDTLRDHCSITRGFPEGTQSAEASYWIGGPQPNGWIDLKDTEGYGEEIRGGFSGAPVWDLELEGIVGIITTADPERRTASLIPIIHLQELFNRIKAIKLEPKNCSDPSLTSEQKKQLTTLISNSFSKDELLSLVDFKLGRDDRRFDNFDQWALPETAFILIKQASQQRYMQSFLSSIIKSKSNNAKLSDFVNSLFHREFEVGTPDHMAIKVCSALNAITQILDNIEIQQIVSQFNDLWNSTRENVLMLQKYKLLHDCLHQLDVGILKVLDGEINNRSPEGFSMHMATLYTGHIDVQATKARWAAKGLPNEAQELRWIESLETIVQQIRTSESSINLQPILVTFRHILSETSRINALLTNSALKLDILHLAEALEKICDRKPDDSLHSHEEWFCKIKQGLDGLQSLQPFLNGLIIEHSAWQWIDKEITFAEKNTGNTVQERFSSWEQTCRELQALCSENKEQPWAISLTLLMDELSQTDNTENELLFGQRFVDFISIAKFRFLQVDSDLLQLADQIVQWGSPIETLSGIK